MTDVQSKIARHIRWDCFTLWRSRIADDGVWSWSVNDNVSIAIRSSLLSGIDQTLKFSTNPKSVMARNLQ